jgi:hypothetical protein
MDLSARFSLKFFDARVMTRAAHDPPTNPWPEAGFESRPCAFGKGLFATRRFDRGATVLEFAGEELTLAVVRLKGPHAADALQIGVDRYLDLVEPGRLVNHSCRPNCGVFDDRQLRALRDIGPGEELTFDYSTTIADGWTMSCGCGCPECRGTVRAFATLPKGLRDRYRVLGCVTGFILRDAGA